MASKINLISNALILIGDNPINTLVGNSRAQVVATNLYSNIVETELTKHRWGFARRKAQLSQTTGTPIDSDYAYIYQLPANLLVLIKVNPNTKYQIYGDKLYTNNSGAMYCDYIENVAESEWPVYFSKMIEYALATDFASSIRDSASSGQDMASKYILASRIARYTDSQQHPQDAIAHKPFLDVRY